MIVRCSGAWGPRPESSIAWNRDPDSPAWKAVELIQRGRMIVDVATADLHEAEARRGPFDPVSWHFRQALAEARDAWDRLRAEFGSKAMAEALAAPPVATIRLGGRGGSGRVILVVIRGQTYGIAQVAGTPLAPWQFRLTRLPVSDEGPFYACRLADGSVQCDCGEWVYQIEGTPGRCKHLAALESLGWLGGGPVA